MQSVPRIWFSAGSGRTLTLAFGLGVAGVTACSETPSASGGSGNPPRPEFNACTVNTDYMALGQVLDGIVSVDEPIWERAEDGPPIYLEPESRVVGLLLNGQAWAIPHSVLWFHEIVNMGAGQVATAVSYCPLTGSSLAFDRSDLGGGAFGVSGLLYQNNLVMFNRDDPESRWSQMAAGAICGPDAGRALARVPAFEMRWDAWLELHPNTWVLAADQGFADLRDLFATVSPYHLENYPYGPYEEIPDYWLPGGMPPLDPRRPPKERVIGVPSSGTDPGIAFPFGALTALEGDFQAVEFSYEGAPALVLWSDAAEGGMAYRPRTEGGEAVTLEGTEDGFTDHGSGSTWTLDGRAVAGTMAGERLVPLEHSFVAFWGAWAAFYSETLVWDD